jgi:hypothetical protein
MLPSLILSFKCSNACEKGHGVAVKLLSCDYKIMSLSTRNSLLQKYRKRLHTYIRNGRTLLMPLKFNQLAVVSSPLLWFYATCLMSYVMFVDCRHKDHMTR